MLVIIITQVVSCVAWSLLLHIFIFLLDLLALLYMCSECTCNKGDDNMFPSLVFYTDMSVDPS